MLELNMAQGERGSFGSSTDTNASHFERLASELAKCLDVRRCRKLHCPDACRSFLSRQCCPVGPRSTDVYLDVTHGFLFVWHNNSPTSPGVINEFEPDSGLSPLSVRYRKCN